MAVTLNIRVIVQIITKIMALTTLIPIMMTGGKNQKSKKIQNKIIVIDNSNFSIKIWTIRNEWIR